MVLKYPTFCAWCVCVCGCVWENQAKQYINNNSNAENTLKHSHCNNIFTFHVAKRFIQRADGSENSLTMAMKKVQKKSSQPQTDSGAPRGITNGGVGWWMVCPEICNDNQKCKQKVATHSSVHEGHQDQHLHPHPHHRPHPHPHPHHHHHPHRINVNIKGRNAVGFPIGYWCFWFRSCRSCLPVNQCVHPTTEPPNHRTTEPPVNQRATAPPCVWVALIVMD